MQSQLAFHFDDSMMVPRTQEVVVTIEVEPLTHVAADLFCGAGGLSFGFQQGGFQIAFANDINEDYANTYRLNHAGTTFFQESIEDLTTAAVYKKTGLRKADVDILIGGPPCQGFSINAPKRSLEDNRNQLFRHYGRLVFEGLRPKVIVMENVPGMVSLDGGRFIEDIYSLFQDAGYRMRHMILCAAHYGIPQERWRLFFIGTNLKNVEITFPEPTHYAPVRANFTGGRHLTWLPDIQNGVRRSQETFASGSRYGPPIGCVIEPVFAEVQ